MAIKILIDFTTMSDIDDDDIIYSLPDDEEESPGEAVCSENGEPEQSCGDESPKESGIKSRRGQMSPLLLMFKVLLNPVEGWKSLNRYKGYTPEVIAKKCFFPLAGITALSCFSDLVYGFGVTLEQVILSGLKTFVTFFLAYYGVIFTGRVLLGEEVGKRLDDRYGRGLVMLALSTLALFFAAMHLLPMLEPVLVFLPLWTIYTVTRGVKYLRVPERRSTIVTTVIAALIIGMPILVDWVFGKLLNL